MRKTLLVAILALVGMQAQAQYCSGGPTSTADSQLDLFELTGEMGTTIDTVQPCSSVATGVTNFTAADTAVVYRDSSYTISLRAGTCGGNYTNRLTVYVDWNQNQTFEAAELVGYVNGLSGGASATQTMTLTVPSGISVGSTRMRVIQHETSASGPSGPCESYSWGSMNDYTITVAGPASSCPTPYALTAAGVGADVVNLAWTTTATSTEIAVVEAGTVVTSSDFNSYSGTTAVVSSLMGDTDYTAYAYDACGSDTVMVNFRTLCSVFATPYSEDFDGGSFVAATNSQGTNGYLSTCWSTTEFTSWSGPQPTWVVGEGTLFYYTDLFLDGDSVVNMEIHWSYSKLENGKANSDIAVLGMIDGMEYTGNVMAEELYQDSLYVKTYRFDDLLPSERMQPVLLMFGDRLFRFNRRALADDAFPCGEFFIKPKEE